MSFVSYAQNFEDVMLWRALKNVEHGFYIDIGANDPTIDSVTKAFYERGWKGINIEPVESHYKNLQVERLRDINLCCAAGETSGEIEVFECDISGWATAEKYFADKLAREGHEGVLHRVPLRTISDICQEYVSGDIHFLKIDVEGLEKDVISGADFQKFRPWIVVVEATKPNSTEEVYKQWEELLLAVSYQFAYADGLNRFYVASERSDLLPAFKYPPNVFDGFIHSEQLNSKLRTQQAEVKAQQAEMKAQQAEKTVNAIYASRSWHITAPLRWAGKAACWFVRGSVAWLTFAPMSRPRLFVSKSVIPIKMFFYSHPRLKALALRLLALFPGLKARLMLVGSHSLPAASSFIIEGPEQLSPRARQIYNDLKAAIEPCRKEQS
jgi:FkbM family methyltransferase